MIKKEHWTENQVKLLLEMWGKNSIEDIESAIGKNETAIKLYLHRKRIYTGNTVKRNLVIEILTLKFIHPECFQPNRNFYHSVKISQKRWWSLYHGRQPVSEQEYMNLIEYFQISLKDAFNARQLTLFTEDDSTEYNR